MKTAPPVIESLLDAITAEVRRPSVGERVAVTRLVGRRPELLDPEQRAMLCDALSSVLARNASEWKHIREALARADGGSAPRKASVDPPKGRPTTRGTRSRRVTGRRILGAGVLAGSVVAALCIWAPHSDAPTPAPPERVDLPVPAPERTETFILSEHPSEEIAETWTHSMPRPLDGLDGLGLVLSGLLLFIAARLAWRIWSAKRHREARRAAQRAAGRRERRRIMRAQLDEPIVVPAHQARFTPCTPATLTRTAALLGDVAVWHTASELDVPRTIEATTATGRWSPQLARHRRDAVLTVFVDIVRGDHLWLGVIRRLLAEWHRRRVALEIYEFQVHPTHLEAPDGRRVDLREIARRKAGGALLIISDQLQPDTRLGPDPWPEIVRVWPTRAWLDPCPLYPDEAVRDAVEALETTGLARFPLTDAGLEALARYFASHGQSPARAPWPILPTPSAEALDRWLFGVATIPDGTTDRAEWVRQALDEPTLDAWWHVRWLADRIYTAAPQAYDPMRPLNISEALAREIRGDGRRRGWRALERRLLEHWHAERTQKCDDELAELERRLARARYLYGLEPTADNRAELVDLLGTAVDRTAREVLETESALHEIDGNEDAAHAIGYALGNAPVGPPQVEMTRLWRGTPGRKPWLAALALAFVGAGLATWAVASWPRRTIGGAVAPARIWKIRDSQRIESTAERPALLRMPTGSFVMGSPPDEQGRDEDEKQHTVRITRAFCLARTEVTQAQWKAVMKTAPSRFDGHPDHPVERVSWWDAVAYLNALSEHEGLQACYRLVGCTGKPGGGCERDNVYCDGDYQCERAELSGLDCPGYRLPTEAEWEYAARASTTGAVYAREPWSIKGQRNAPALADIAWYGGNSGVEWEGAYDCSGWREKAEPASRCGTHPVGLKTANPWKLHDMIGNVWEWTHDEYERELTDGEDPYTRSATRRTASVRGCGWSSTAAYCRAAERAHDRPVNRDADQGFRPARSCP